MPKAPFLLMLCKVKNHPLWPKEALWKRTGITHTEGSNQANSSFLLDHFTVTICVRLDSHRLISWKSPWFLWRSMFSVVLLLKCPSQPSVNSVTDLWTNLLLCRMKEINTVAWGHWLMRGLQYSDRVDEWLFMICWQNQAWKN